MKVKYLLPHRYKKFGWLILLPSLLIGLYVFTTHPEPEFLDAKVFALVDEDIFEDPEYFKVVNNNILDELIGVLIIVGAILVAFSREKVEDEFITKIRLESLVWATYINYAILLVSLILIYYIAFLSVMILNMFALLLFFIIKFHWEIWKLNKSLSYAE